MSVALVLFAQAQLPPFKWSLGKIYQQNPTVSDIIGFFRDIKSSDDTDAVLFWDEKLGQPNEQLIGELLTDEVDVWHAGLAVGTAGLPGLLDFVKPVWQFNCDVPLGVEGTSWRLSLKCCLIRIKVIRHLEGPNQLFKGLDAAALELGYRYIVSGVLIRYVPRLCPVSTDMKVEIDFEDEMRFIGLSADRKFCYWAVFRAILTGYVPIFSGLTALRQIRRENLCPAIVPFTPVQDAYFDYSDFHDKYVISVLIATLDRYPYLRTVLNQLRNQTIRPSEIIIVDQTPDSRRDNGILNDFSDLPLKLIYKDEPGQCSSRNMGLQIAEGEYILFIDDDDEIQPDLIENHIRNLNCYNAGASSGKVNEVGAMLPTDAPKVIKLSDVFPTSNTLIQRDVLAHSGLFDMAFERKQSEDGDLGMRMYLAGATMIYNSEIAVYHHRAPQGGLRSHRVRMITFASSRQKLFHRRLPHVSEIYMHYRYSSPRQIREADWLTVLGTFSIRGSAMRKSFKIIAALIMLPDTVLRLRHRHREAKRLLTNYPQIPALSNSDLVPRERSSPDVV